MVAFLDLSAGQFAADLLLIAVIAANAYLGWRYGLLRRIFGIAGLYLACLAATNVGNPVAAAVHPGSLDANAWAFVAVFVVVLVGVEILGFLFNDQIQHIGVMVFDRVAGMVTGVFVGLAEALVLFIVAYAVASAPGIAAAKSRSDASAANAIQASMLAGQAVRIAPQIHLILSSVLPEDLAQHLAEGAPRVVTPPV